MDLRGTLQRTNISHLGKRKIIVKSALVGDMLGVRILRHFFRSPFPLPMKYQCLFLLMLAVTAYEVYNLGY